MSASTRWSRSSGGSRSVRFSALLLVALTVALIGGAGRDLSVAAAPSQTGAGSAGVTLDSFEQGCLYQGGQPFEITDDNGGVVTSVCEHKDGTVDECEWGQDICNWGQFSRVQPTPSGPLDDVSVDPDDLGGVLDEEPPPLAATEPPAEETVEPATEPATEAADESATEPAIGATEEDAPATEASTTEAASQSGPSGGTGGDAADAQSGQSASGQEPASLTIVVFTCEAGYDPFDLDADPGQDCSEPTDGVPFALTGDGTDTTRSAGDDGSGTARFEELAPGVYRLAGQPPSWGGVAFVHDCVSSIRSFDDAAFFPLAMVGPTGTLGLTLMPSEALECGWYQVAAGD